MDSGTHRLMHTYTDTQARTDSGTHTHRHTYTQALTDSGTHTHRHAQTQAHIHTGRHRLRHAHTETHTDSGTVINSNLYSNCTSHIVWLSSDNL
ncbi:hypothetical protein XELAEV_18029116mg [Xenopus laevis]|uniref:Uncharacterized protein n=1 Tax=Xenopus laevis TaxID=8355 RepID=A0A974HHB4_XENLA|nr:hypothetical protein XELAEV_18029116mg [Xenopus laevis]